ncbi:MAG: translational GTPase TypA, partial [Acidimicrobiaceae bacterium]
PENPAPFIKRKISTLFAFRGIGREEVAQVAAGDLFILAGIDEVEVGDTIAAIENAPALPRLEVDEPVLRMSFGVNTSPFAGRDGTFLTSRHLSERLFKEVLGNVSIRVNTTDSPDVIEVAGRGELQLAVLIENMRREGYELQVSRPEVITKEIDGKKHE